AGCAGWGAQKRLVNWFVGFVGAQFRLDPRIEVALRVDRLAAPIAKRWSFAGHCQLREETDSARDATLAQIGGSLLSVSVLHVSPPQNTDRCTSTEGGYGEDVK